MSKLLAIRGRRGQLSIETMIIYGLIILVALSAVGALLYFNVLDLGSYLPDNCNMGGTGELDCEEMSFSSSGGGSLALGVRNIGQRPLEELEVSVVDSNNIHFGTVGPVTAEYNGDPVSDSNPLPPGSSASVTFANSGGQSGKVLRGTIQTTYKYIGGAITQESSGSIRVKAS